MKTSNGSTGWMALIAALTCTTALTQNAYAQEAPSTAPATVEEPTGAQSVDEVVSDQDITVTARRREERLLEIPVAISALSDDALVARNVIDVVGISNFSPGFHFNNENLGRNDRGFTTLTFRGIDAGTFLVTRQPAQAFLDGIPIIGGNIPGLEDVQRVEVIKGPQSAYFGRSTFSGAINFITKDPSFSFGGRVKAEAAKYGTVDTSLMVEGPLVEDVLALRLTARSYTTDGQYENSADSGERLGARATRSFAATMLYQPSTAFRAKLFFTTWEDKDGPAADSLTGAAQRNCDPLGVGQDFYVCGAVPFNLTNSQIGKVTTVDQSFRQNFLTSIADGGLNTARVVQDPIIDGAGLVRHATQMTAALGYELDSGISFDLMGGYNDNTFQTIPGTVVFGPARTPNPFFVPNGFAGRQRRFSEDLVTVVDQANEAYGGEFRVTSPGADAFRWMVGVSSFFQQAQGRSYGEAASASGINDGALITDRDVMTTGVFTALAYDFVPELTLNLEGRYQWDDVNSQVIDGPGGPGATTGPVYQKTFKSFQPRAILQWKPSQNLNIYASAARSYRPGDFNANLGLFTDAERAEIERETGANSVVLDQEKLWMYEVGVKGRFFDGILSGSIAGYYGDWTNIHVFTNLTINDTGPGTGRGVDIATSSGDAKLYGIEAEGVLKITDRLVADFSFGYTRSKLGSAYRCSTCEVLIGTRIVTGNQKARVPETQGNLGLTYSAPLNDEVDLSTRVDFLHKGNIWAEDANIAGTGDANKVNASLTLQKGDVSITLYGTNIFDNKTIPSLTPTINSFDRGTPITGYPLGPGRAVRLSLPDRPVYGLRTVIVF